jgi:hypothetical protein
MLVFRRQYSIGLEDLKDGGKAVTIGVDEFVGGAMCVPER